MPAHCCRARPAQTHHTGMQRTQPSRFDWLHLADMKVLCACRQLLIFLQEGANTAKGPGGFKAQREAQQRAQAGDRAAWSTLFMRSDTVAAAVAEHYGITKAQLLDKEASDLPVRMALGETHVIALTKRKLGDAGLALYARLRPC